MRSLITRSTPYILSAAMLSACSSKSKKGDDPAPIAPTSKDVAPNDGKNGADGKKGADGKPAADGNGAGTAANAAGTGTAAAAVIYGAEYDAQLISYLNAYGVAPADDKQFAQASAEKVALGKKLFNDPMLSWNGKVSCASCHLSTHGTANSYSLQPSGFLLANEWSNDHHCATPAVLGRNTPGLFNLGHNSFTTMFWDSRVGINEQGVPYAPTNLPWGLENALAVQALFPLATSSEMAGCTHGALGYSSSGPQDVWNSVMWRVMNSVDYPGLFAAAYPSLQSQQIGIQHLANAIAAFEAVAFRSEKSPFDSYMRGDRSALSAEEKRGATIFYGKGNCASCHNGPFQTDHKHHNVAVVQFGPGGDGEDGREDYGFGRTKMREHERYQFKTPSLRNVALTAPYGHDGAYATLREFVAHYNNPVDKYHHWNEQQVNLPNGTSFDSNRGAWHWNWHHELEDWVTNKNEAKGIHLSDDEIDAVVTFLNALTDPNFK